MLAVAVAQRCERSSHVWFPLISFGCHKRGILGATMRRALSVLLLLASCARAPKPERTWRTFAEPFCRQYCIRCHSPAGGKAPLDYTRYAEVIGTAELIRCGMAPPSHPSAHCSSQPHAGEFPLGTGPFPTDAERLAFIAWIEAGAPY